MALKKTWFYRDCIGFKNDKYSPGEIIGTLALVGGACLAVMQLCLN